MTKHILTKEQRAAGLEIAELEHILSVIDKVNNKTVAVFSTSGATIKEIQQAAQDYMVERGKKEADELYNIAMEAYQESLENGGFRNG